MLSKNEKMILMSILELKKLILEKNLKTKDEKDNLETTILKLEMLEKGYYSLFNESQSRSDNDDFFLVGDDEIKESELLATTKNVLDAYQILLINIQRHDVKRKLTIPVDFTYDSSFKDMIETYNKVFPEKFVKAKFYDTKTGSTFKSLQLLSNKIVNEIGKIKTLTLDKKTFDEFIILWDEL